MKQIVMLALLLAPASSYAAEPATTTPNGSVPATLRMPVAVVDAAQPGDPGWQRKYDAALDRRRSGLRKVVIGLVMEGAGIAMMVASGPGDVSCSYYGCETSSSKLTAIGTLTALGGAVPFWWGVVQWIGANGDVHSLEAMRPRDARAVTMPMGGHQQLVVDTGHGMGLAYGVTW